MTRRIRARLRAARADEGISLVEVIVAMGLGLVVMIGATGMMITTQKFARGSAVRNSNTLDAGIAAQTIAKYLSSTTAICGPDDATSFENTCAHMISSSDTEHGEILWGSTYKDMTFFSNFDVDGDGISGAAGTGVGTITIPYRAPWKVHVYVTSSGDLRADLYKGTGNDTACCTYSSTVYRSQLLAQSVKVVAPSGTSVPGAPFSFWSDPSGTSKLYVDGSAGLTAVPKVTSSVGSPVDLVGLDIIVNRGSNPKVSATEVKNAIPLVNRTHDQSEWKTFS